MSLVVRIDSGPWHDHVRSVIEQHPGIVPVAKGNGYGFTNAYLARAAARHGAEMLAVGSQDELDQVTSFGGDKLVLLPWHPATATRPCGDEIHTIAHLDALAALATTTGAPRRIVLKLPSPMNRFGVWDLTAAADQLRDVDVVGLSVHAPPGAGAARDTQAAVGRAARAGLPIETLFVSHLRPEDETALAGRWGCDVRSRIGTRLWLEPGTAEVRSQLLDVHRAHGDEVGYHRVAAKGRTIAVVSGGTSHGIGLDAPRIVRGVRPLAREAAKKAEALVGKLRSPFSFHGTRLDFVEPPHAQVSMLWLPVDLASHAQIGSELTAKVRFTTLWPDYCVEANGAIERRIGPDGEPLG